MTVVEVRNLVKNYGDFQAVKRISFQIDKGEIFGLIGPNGAGKTTTLRVLSTLLTITSGTVKIMEFDLVTPFEIKAFHDRWEGIADQVQVTGVHDWSGAINDLTITDETSSVRFPCALLWYALAINSNGKVSICNVDWDYSGEVGDIHINSINKIWNDAPIKKIRKAHLESRWDYVPVCNSCVVWTSVGNIKPYLLTRQEFIF